MALSPVDRIVERLQARRAGPARFAAKCPAHHDRSPSLSISAGRDGRVLLRCFAGCELNSILEAGGLTMRDLFAGPPPTRAQLIAAEEARFRVDAIRRQRGMVEREYNTALREGYRERDSAAKRVARKLVTMDVSDGASIFTLLLHDLIEERRSVDRAIIGDPDDYLPMEKPVPPKPYRLGVR